MAGAAVVGAGAVAAEQQSVRQRLDQLVHPVPEPPSDVPAARPGAVVSGSFVSPARGGRRVGWTIAYPRGTSGRGLPVALVLHGRGDNHRTVFGSHAWGHFLQAA